MPGGNTDKPYIVTDTEIKIMKITFGNASVSQHTFTINKCLVCANTINSILEKKTILRKKKNINIALRYQFKIN